MTIYLDVVLIENLLMNYIILYATSIVLKMKAKHIRLIIASLLGAIYSIIAYTSILEIYSSMILKIILSVIIVYIAYNPQNVKQLWKCILIFYMTSFVFGGAAFALIYIVKPKEIFMKNGLFMGIYPLKTVLLGAIIAFFIIITSFKIVKSKISKKEMFCTAKVKINNKEIETQVMIDTGNLLKEPITNTPVIVLEHTLLYDCMPKEILNNLENILGGDFDSVTEKIKMEYLSKLKVIPFSSLGKQNGMLLGIKPEYIIIKTEENEQKINNVIVGIYNKSLTKKGEYRGLIGIDLL